VGPRCPRVRGHNGVRDLFQSRHRITLRENLLFDEKLIDVAKQRDRSKADWATLVRSSLAADCSASRLPFSAGSSSLISPSPSARARPGGGRGLRRCRSFPPVPVIGAQRVGVSFIVNSRVGSVIPAPLDQPRHRSLNPPRNQDHQKYSGPEKYNDHATQK